MLCSRKSFKADVKYLACTERSFIQKHSRCDGLMPRPPQCSQRHPLTLPRAWWAPRKAAVTAPEERVGVGRPARPFPWPRFLSQRYKLARAAWLTEGASRNRALCFHALTTLQTSAEHRRWGPGCCREPGLDLRSGVGSGRAAQADGQRLDGPWLSHCSTFHI